MKKSVKTIKGKKLLVALAPLALAFGLALTPSVFEGETNTASASIIETKQNQGKSYSGFVDLSEIDGADGEAGTATFNYEDGTVVHIPVALKQTGKEVDFNWVEVSPNIFELDIKIDGKTPWKLESPVIVEMENKNNHLVATYSKDVLVAPYTKTGNQFVIEVSNPYAQYEFVGTTVTFNDIKNHQLRPYIEELATRQIIKGVTATEFKPENPITKAQMSTLFSRALDLKATYNSGFKDLDKHWAKNEIQAMINIGVYSSKDLQQIIFYNGGMFNPDKPLTRAETILFIYRALKSEGVEVPKAKPTFKDNAQLGNDAELLEAAGALQKLEIFVGYNGTLSPKSNVTRAQTAKVLQMTLDLINKQ